MSIASEITRIKNAKASIKTSIENKGVTVGDGTLDTYANKIDAIETGITPTGTINITENGTYDVTDKASANVNVSGGDTSEYFTETISGNQYGDLPIAQIIKKLPSLKINNNATRVFQGCSNLTNIGTLDTSNVTNMNHMFDACYVLASIPTLDTSNVTNMSYMFQNCKKIISAPTLDTSKVTNMNGMFRNCEKLTNISLTNTSNVTNMNSMFSGCSSLTTLGGFQNLGQAFLTTASANYSNYTLDLSASSKITHDSLMNVINNLYDIATKGCNTQKLVLGSANLAKLSDEEKAIATNKGWVLS